MNTIPLCELQPGQCAIVWQLNTVGRMRRRLLDLGLTPGTPVCCVGVSPGGDPAAYGIRQAVIAIRRADGATVRVQPIEEEDTHGTDQRGHRPGCGG